MKIKINYFTSTGNTLWMTNKLKENFEKMGAEVVLYDSATCTDECFEDCDIIGFAYPVWGSAMPNPQRNILDRMKNGNGRKVFFIGNAGAFCGDTGISTKKLLITKATKLYTLTTYIYPLTRFFLDLLFSNSLMKPKSKRWSERQQ